MRTMNCWILTLLVALPLPAQTVDEIVDKYVEARGGKARIAEIDTLTATGTALMGGEMEVPFVYQWKRPDHFRFELTTQGMTEVQAFDGEDAWFTDPPGQTEPADMPPMQFAMLNDALDFLEGPLVRYREKGHEVELLGLEEIEGTEAYKLRVTKKGGVVEISYLDPEYFVEILQFEKHQTPGGEMELVTTLGDYKEVDGVMLPHAWERKPRGAPAGIALMFEKIELNGEIPDSRFARPAPSD